MIVKIFIYLFFTVGANLLLRYSGIVKVTTEFCMLGIKVNIITLLAILCYGCGFISLMTLIQNNKLSYIAPILGVLVNGFIVIGAIIFLKEQLTITQSIGIALGIGAIIFLTI